MFFPIIKIISHIGIVAMLAVGGGIIAHETHILHFLDSTVKSLGSFSTLVSIIIEIIFGIIIGYITVKLMPFLLNIFNILKKIKS